MKKSIQSSPVYLYLYSYNPWGSLNNSSDSILDNKLIARLPYSGELSTEQIIKTWWKWADKVYVNSPTQVLDFSNLSIFKAKYENIFNILNIIPGLENGSIVGIVRYEIRN